MAKIYHPMIKVRPFLYTTADSPPPFIRKKGAYIFAHACKPYNSLDNWHPQFFQKATSALQEFVVAFLELDYVKEYFLLAVIFWLCLHEQRELKQPKAK